MTSTTLLPPPTGDGIDHRLAEVARLESALVRHMRQVERLQLQLSDICQAVVSTVSAILEARDASICTHSENVTAYATRVAEELGLSEEETEEVRLAAILHDVGKVGVAEALLRKPGPLDADEWQVMRRHPELGHRLLGKLPLPRATTDGVRYHHERYDGTGYPHGLAGEDIPMTARIVAVVDAFDAMTSQRPYRAPLTLEQARAEIARCSGTHFCPSVVDAFLRITAETAVAA